MSDLETALGYHFKNKKLLEQALTHRSLAHETKKELADNQRLEFLGDSVLQLALTEELFSMFPDLTEGKLTQLRARLVSGDALHTCAQRIDLGCFLKMGKGEEASGGRDRGSILADGLEALLGAIFLDSGFSSAKQVVKKICAQGLEEIMKSPEENNPKGQLQEMLQLIGQESPTYHLIEESGPEHHKTFTCSVTWKGETLGMGTGKSKKMAESQAASIALKNRLWKTKSY